MSAADPAPRTLWRDEARRRFYLVPDTVAPELGTLVLRAGAARRIEVGESSVAPYEVTKDEARAFLDAKLDGFVGGVKRSVEDALSKLGIPIPGTSSPDATTAASSASPASGDSGDASRPATSSRESGHVGDAMPDVASPIDNSAVDGSVDATPSSASRSSGDAGRSGDATPGDASPTDEPGPGVRLFAALTGEAPEDVTNPEVLIRALRRLGDGAVEVAQQALRGEEGKAAARARLRALADTFREHGIPIPRGESEPVDSPSPTDSASRAPSA